MHANLTRAQLHKSYGDTKVKTTLCTPMHKDLIRLDQSGGCVLFELAVLAVQIYFYALYMSTDSLLFVHSFKKQCINLAHDALCQHILYLIFLC